jgi:hypothetical protein
MNQREKILAGCVAGVLVGYVGFALFKSQVREPRDQLKNLIQGEKEYRARLQARLDRADEKIGVWNGYTSQTLHEEWFAAHQAFREDVGLLLKRNNLTQDLKINKYKERVEEKGPREGFVELPLSVRVDGKLSDLDNFLKDFFQRPYLVRLDKLQLNAEQGGSAQRKRGGSDEPNLSITMTLSTLVLPKVKNVDHPTFDLAAYNHPDPEAEVVMATPRRLWQEDMDRYGEIVEKNPFKNYEPPPPPPPPPAKQREPERKRDDRPPVSVPPPDPRRDADKFVLNGMGWLDDGPIAYVTRTDEPGEPPTGYRLNDDVDDGRLVLVVPAGIVVRTAAPLHGARQQSKNYFYPLGGTFKDREEVNPSDHPEIERQLRVVLRQ